MDESELNSGSIKEWLDGLRKLQEHRNSEEKWLGKLDSLCKGYKGWLDIFDWAEEVYLRVNAEPHSLAMFVKVKKNHQIVVNDRLLVSDFGLIMGGIFDVRCEARIVNFPLEKCDFTIKN